jgi:hypothetical protein
MNKMLAGLVLAEKRKPLALMTVVKKTDTIEMKVGFQKNGDPVVWRSWELNKVAM